jgi:hypothetical protein
MFILENNIYYIIGFGILLLWFLYFLYRLYKQWVKKYRLLFLFLSFFFLSINILWIKWEIIKSIKNTNLSKIVFVMDVSKSMNSKDIISSNHYISRLLFVKESILKFIKTSYNKYWLIIFAWEASEILPFTTDYSIFSTILPDLDSDNIFEIGTNIDSVFVSLEHYFLDNEWGWTVIIFTDWGEWNIESDIKKYNILKNKNINIILVWVGTLKWAKIPIWKDIYWKDIYKKYNNNYVVTKLNEKWLIDLSKKFNIKYLKLNNYNDFKKIFNYIDTMSLKNKNKIIFEQREEYTRFLVLLSFIFFILSFNYSNLLWKQY